MRWYILGATVSAGLGVLAWVMHFPGSDLFIYPNGKRVQGLYLDPNAFGPYLVPEAVICLEDLMRPRLLRWPSPLVLLSFITLALGVVLSFSRAATANLALACLAPVLIYAMRSGRRKALVRGLAILAACIACAGGTLVQTGAISILQQRAQAQGYDSQRFSNQGQALDKGTTRLLGYGPGAVQTEPRSTPTRRSSGASTRTASWASRRCSFSFSPRRRRPGEARCATMPARASGVLRCSRCWLGLSFNGLVVDTYHYRILWLLAALVLGCGERADVGRPCYAGNVWARPRARDLRRLYAHADRTHANDSLPSGPARSVCVAASAPS